MATATPLKNRAAKAGAGLRVRPLRLAGAKGHGARPVGVKRNKPNPVLLGGLGLVVVAGLARVATPGLFGAGGTGVKAFPPPITNRHLVARLPVPTTVAGTGSAQTASGRPSRNPFTPPPGFGGS